MRKSSKVRISLDCSAEERRLIKALASLGDMTISDYILTLARSKMSQISSLGSYRKEQPQSKADDPWDAFLASVATERTA